MPVGREKARKPLGHCGHLKLLEVVGSTLIKKGNPQGCGFDNIRE